MLKSSTEKTGRTYVLRSFDLHLLNFLFCLRCHIHSGNCQRKRCFFGNRYSERVNLLCARIPGSRSCSLMVFKAQLHRVAVCQSFCFRKRIGQNFGNPLFDLFIHILRMQIPCSVSDPFFSRYGHNTRILCGCIAQIPLSPDKNKDGIPSSSASMEFNVNSEAYSPFTLTQLYR